MQILSVGLIFLSFFTLVYWSLDLGKVSFIKGLAPFFDGIRDFVHLFYQRTVEISGQTVDFSFFVAIIIMLLIAWGLKLLAEYVRCLEVKYEFIYLKFKKGEEDRFNFVLMQQYLAEEFKNNKFAFLIKFKIENTLRDEYYGKGFNEIHGQKEAEIIQDFSETIETALKCDIKVVNGCIFSFANRFKNVDKSIAKLIDCIKKLKDKYSQEYWDILSFASIDTYADDNELDDKLDTLSRLLTLDAENEILCLSSFRQRYSLVESPKYSMNTQGVYTSKGERQDVFYIKKLK